MAACYLLNALLDQIETFVDCYLIPSCIHTIRLPAEKDYPAGITVRLHAKCSELLFGL